eukprot:2122195-Pleurochrysis_carterae.AAC.1
MERTGLNGAEWNSFEVEQTRWSVYSIEVKGCALRCASLVEWTQSPVRVTRRARAGRAVRAKVRIARGVDAKPRACTRRACTGRAVRAK